VELMSLSAEETRLLGERLGLLLQPGDFILLKGDLGAGKTHFVQGVARGLAVPAEYRVTSPTYTLLNIFPGRLPLYHFDLYRLAGSSEVAELGFDEYFSGSGACLVEWAERLGPEEPGDSLVISMRYLDEDRRQLRFTARGERSAELLRQFAALEKTFDP
jgi:tRNA threonylcarbamoyladenosine biosynthesis protein TsaE